MSRIEDNDDEVKKKILSLVKGIIKGDTRNYKFEIASASKPGDNWLGLMYSVLIVDGMNSELDLIVKMAPYQKPYRKVLPIRVIYDREIFVYDNISPQFVKLQEEKGAKIIFQPFVKHYMTTLQSHGEALVMDNMKSKGFITGNHRVEVDYPHALLVMKELGKFHAMSLAMRDQKPGVFNHLQENCQETFFNSDSFEPVLTMIKNLGNSVLESYDPIKDSLYIEALERSLSQVNDTFAGMRLQERYGEYAVLNHGDVQMRNIMFKYGDSAHPSTPTELCLIDWQLVHVASPAFDILWFIFVCTGQEFRNLHYKQLLQEYYDSLSTLLRQLGSNPEKLLPFEILMEHLKQFAPYGLHIAIWIAALNMKGSATIPDLYNSSEDVIIEHLSVAPSEAYMKKIRGVVSDFIMYGYNF